MNVGLVKTSSGTYGPRPTRMAVVPCPDMVSGKKLTAGLMVHSTIFHVSHLADRRIDKTVAERDVPRRSNSKQADSGTTGIGFADTGIQLFQRVAHVGKTVLASLEGVVAILPSQIREGIEDVVHLLCSDMVEPVRARRGRRKSNRIETQFSRQVPVDLFHVAHLGSKRNPRADRIRPVLFQKVFDFRRDDVITTSPIMEHSHLVVQFLVAVDTDRDADAVLGKKVYYLFGEKSSVGSKTELDPLAQFGHPAGCVFHSQSHDREVQQRFAAKKKEEGLKASSSREIAGK